MKIVNKYESIVGIKVYKFVSLTLSCCPHMPFLLRGILVSILALTKVMFGVMRHR